MNNLNVITGTTNFDVFTIDREPQIGDKWEDKRNIYTITSVQEVILSQCWSTPYYVVNLDVFDKEICSPDEPETVLMELDPETVLMELDIKEREEEILKNDIAIQDEWERQDKE